MPDRAADQELPDTVGIDSALFTQRNAAVAEHLNGLSFIVFIVVYNYE